MPSAPMKSLHSNVHATSEGRISSAWTHWYQDACEGRGLMGWLEETGLGDGRGPGEHTWVSLGERDIA